MTGCYIDTLFRELITTDMITTGLFDSFLKPLQKAIGKNFALVDDCFMQQEKD